MSEWKAGGKAMVEIAHISASGGINLCRAGDFFIDPDVLRPLPTDPHQALKDAVIEAVRNYMKDGFDSINTLFKKMREAVGALEAALATPKPDPVEVFYEAVDRQHLCDNVFHPSHRNCLKNVPACHCRRYIAEGLAAVEAARGAK